MVVMNDDLWTKIVDNVYGLDEVLTQRMDNEVHTISNTDLQYLMNTLEEDYKRREYGVADEEKLKVQDRHYVGYTRGIMDMDNRIWITLNACKED